MLTPSATATPAGSVPKTQPLPAAAAATSSSAAAEPQVLVHRPAPGLGRGAFEAPAWAFYGVLGVLIVASVAYVGYRLGWFRRSDKGAAS